MLIKFYTFNFYGLPWSSKKYCNTDILRTKKLYGKIFQSTLSWVHYLPEMVSPCFFWIYLLPTSCVLCSVCHWLKECATCVLCSVLCVCWLYVVVCALCVLAVFCVVCFVYLYMSPFPSGDVLMRSEMIRRIIGSRESEIIQEFLGGFGWF